jgi:hypothetical protein
VVLEAVVSVKTVIVVVVGVETILNSVLMEAEGMPPTGPVTPLMVTQSPALALCAAANLRVISADPLVVDTNGEANAILGLRLLSGVISYKVGPEATYIFSLVPIAR